MIGYGFGRLTMGQARFLRSMLALMFVLHTSCTAAREQRDHAATPISSSRLWEAVIRVGSKAEWTFGSPRMVISPSRPAGMLHVPYDLSDAWRELDHMMPKNYVTYMVAHASGEFCYTQDTDEQAQLAHVLFAGFLSEKWLAQGNSRYWEYFATIFDFSLPADASAARSEFAGDMRSIAANWTICSFYQWKRAGTYPSFANLVAAFRVGVDDAKRRRIQEAR